MEKVKKMERIKKIEKVEKMGVSALPSPHPAPGREAGGRAEWQSALPFVAAIWSAIVVVL